MILTNRRIVLFAPVWRDQLQLLVWQRPLRLTGPEYGGRDCGSCLRGGEYQGVSLSVMFEEAEAVSVVVLLK